MDALWTEVLALAWEAYRAGTIPVGSLVADPSGSVVARGRNRIFAPHDGIVGTRLAHAEVMALAQLPSSRRYLDHVLYSSLEPCAYCAGAALHSTIGGVRFLATDPYGGGYTVSAPPRFPHRAPTVEGPHRGPAARVSTTLQAAYWLRRDESTADAILAAFEADDPGCVDAADRLLREDLPESFEEALPRLLAITS